MDHRQEYPERDELRAKFTRWLVTVIKRAKIDYLRKYENRPETISYEDIPEKELIDLAQRELWPSSTRTAVSGRPERNRNSQKAQLLVAVC